MTVDELMSLVDVYADARGFYLRHIHSPPNIAANRIAGDKLRAALEAVVADAERLDWLQENPGCNLISDDAERWALSSCGFQPVPEDGGFTSTVTINSIVTVDEWQIGVRAAIDTARSAGAKGGA